MLRKRVEAKRVAGSYVRTECRSGAKLDGGLAGKDLRFTMP